MSLFRGCYKSRACVCEGRFIEIKNKKLPGRWPEIATEIVFLEMYGVEGEKRDKLDLD